MKKQILLALALGAALLAFGQQREIAGGGGGHFITGITAIFDDNVVDYLREPYVMGVAYDPSRLGIQAGGEGYGMIGRFTIGGGGFGFSTFNSSIEDGKVERGGGGGYFKLGYRFYTKNTSFATVNAGVGAFGYKLKITNNHDEVPIYFNQSDPIQPGHDETYEFGGTLFDFGLSFKSVITSKPTDVEVGGFMAGIDAGCMFGVPSGEWKGGDEMVGPPEPGLLFAPYIRLTIGGGGFKFE